MSQLESTRADNGPRPKSILRRLLKWVAVLIGVVVVLVAVAVFAAYRGELKAASEDMQRYPAPGHLVDIGGYRLHVLSKGEGSPTVILDNASLDTVSGWYWILEELSKETRVVAYDRPGSGWSDLGPEPRDVDLNTGQLHDALVAEGIEGPYILVGHSLGGLYARAFAGRYPDEVAGVVLVEATHPDFPARLGLPNVMPNADEGMLNLGPYAARLGLLRKMKMFPPDTDLPERQQQELNAYYASARFADRVLSDFNQWPNLLEQAASVQSFGATPLCVVVGGASENATGVPLELQEELGELSINSKLVVIDGASHVSLVHNREYAHQIVIEIVRLVGEARGQSGDIAP